MSYETDERLKNYLDTNQLGREQMCRSILALDRRFTEVIPRQPRGGADGGRDLQATYNSSMLTYAAVGFINQANDSDEQKKRISSKFRDDLENALSQPEKPSVFCFLTNLNLTVADKEKLGKEAKSRGIAICEIMDRERLRIALDSSDGFSIRFQHLGIPLSEAEQASFFAKWGADIDSLISSGFQHVNHKLDRMIFLQEATEVLTNLTIRIQLDKKYTGDEIGHFRLFCRLFLKSFVGEVSGAAFGSSDRSDRFYGAKSDSSPKQSGIKHGISFVSWETLVSAGKKHPLVSSNHPEKFNLIGCGASIGSEFPEFISTSFGYDEFIRVQHRPRLMDFDDALYVIYVNESLMDKVSAIHIYANGYKLNEYSRQDFVGDRSKESINPGLPGDFSSEELQDRWLRIQPKRASCFRISFSDHTPKRMYETPLASDSLSRRVVPIR